MTNNGQNWPINFACDQAGPYAKASDVVSYDSYAITADTSCCQPPFTGNVPWAQYDYVKDARSLESQQGISRPVNFDVEAPNASGANTCCLR